MFLSLISPLMLILLACCFSLLMPLSLPLIISLMLSIRLLFFIDYYASPRYDIC